MRILLTVLLLLVGALPRMAAAQTIEAPAQALTRDAAEYVKFFAVPQAEAERRLTALEASVPITDQIEARYRDRIAGISIQHRPDFRINVYLTGDDPVPSEQLQLGGMTVPVTFRTGARASRDRVIWAVTWHQAQIRAMFSRPPAMGLDPRTGELVVLITSGEAKSGVEQWRKKVEGVAGVPVSIRVVDQVDVNLSAPPLGGARLEGTNPDDGKRYLCTSGFVVTDGARYGIATAAHCLDQMSFIAPDHSEVPLSFVGQWGWGYHDVQIGTVPGPLAGLFYADTARTIERPVTGSRTRDQTRAGDFVCHRGERTGYSCAVVELTDFAPAGDLCGGACLPTWVTVSGPTCKGGDSGSPVFSGTTALGILKGATYRPDGSCAFYFYMSVDYLPQPWSLVLGTPSTTPPLPPVAPPEIGARGQP
jgi:streptogrisin C